MPSKRSKGQEFERAICKELSLWWTGGKRDDVFWRTSQSGGRATNRAKKGQGTYGQHGDIQAVDPIGEGLTRKVTIELKRGCSNDSIHDFLDRPRKRKHPLLDFLRQSRKQARKAKTSWLLIWRRDRRESVLFLPPRLLLDLRLEEEPRPLVVLTARGRRVCATPLESFLSRVHPRQFKEL